MQSIEMESSCSAQIRKRIEKNAEKWKSKDQTAVLRKRCGRDDMESICSEMLWISIDLKRNRMPCEGRDTKRIARAQRKLDKEEVGYMPTLNLRLEMDPPRTTHQQKKVRIVGSGKNARPMFYEPDALRVARREYILRLARLKPDKPIKGPVKLVTVFSYKSKTKKQNGQPKITRPDTDNIIKLLKDCMTDCGFWEDDSQVYDDRVIKRYADRPCVMIGITWGEDIKEREI